MADTATKAMPAFRKGAEAMEEAAAKARRSFQRDQFLSIDDGDSVIIRFITDEPEWISVDQYGFLPTKPKPKDYEGKWPSKMPAVSRSDEAFAGMYEDDYIAEFMRDPKTKEPYRPSPRNWAYACLREEVKKDGKVIGYRDMEREVEVKDGDKTKTITEKAIVIVNLGYKNFFATMVGYAQQYGTVLDRDYKIKRKGDGTDTTYSIIPLDPIKLGKDSKYTGIDGRYDLRDPEIAARYEPATELWEIVAYRASDEYMRRWFDPRFEDETGEKKSKKSGSKTKSKKDDDDDDDGDDDDNRLARLKERVTSYGSDDDDDAPAAAADDDDDNDDDDDDDDQDGPVALDD